MSVSQIIPTRFGIMEMCMIDVPALWKMISGTDINKQGESKDEEFEHEHI